MQQVALKGQRRFWSTGFVLGLLGFLLFLVLTQWGVWRPLPDGRGILIGRVMAVTWLMGCWWISEALPIPVTSLLPMVCFPLMGVMSGHTVAREYMNEVIVLFMGGFFLALAIQRWGLHKRLALLLLSALGTSPRRLLLGFMVTSGGLSMWISNTATTLMLLPMGLSIFALLEERGMEKSDGFQVALFLGIAYSASVGGMATLVGTPPNLSFVRIYALFFPNAPEVSFTAWMRLSFPISLVLLILFWVLLVWVFFRDTLRPVEAEDQLIMWLAQQKQKLGPLVGAERVVLVVFTLTIGLWISRSDLQLGADMTIPGWCHWFVVPAPSRPRVHNISTIQKFVSKGVSHMPARRQKNAHTPMKRQKTWFGDGVVAMLMALVLFLWPTPGGGRVLDWETAQGIPWGMLLLFGGGFALAAGIKQSGMSIWMGQFFQWRGLSGVGTFVLLWGICLVLSFLTEFTSNMATTEISLALVAPIVATFGGTG
ncbi:MAG: SLC13 family permease, partial [Myxococcota bacterium]